MDEQDKERFLTIAEFLESGYCGDHQQRIQAGAAMRELIAAVEKAQDIAQRAEAAEAQLVIATRTIKLVDENAELRVAQVIKRAKAAEAALAKAQDDGRALNRMLDETLQEVADALEEIISLRRSEGHNADKAIGRLQALRPDSEYLRQ